MKKFIISVVLIVASLLVIAQSKFPMYVEFLSKNTTAPVDYIFKLFEEKDIVVLTERDHREITQYDLIYNIVSDQRFDAIKNIFTEVGVSNLTNEINNILINREITKSRFKAGLDSIYQNISFFPYWEKRNYYDFLSKMHDFNLSHTVKRTMYFSDVPFTWNNLTRKKYIEFFQAVIPKRDSIIAMQIINRLEGLNKGKALVILNYRHGFGNIYINNKKVDNAGRYLKEHYGEKIAFVMLNSLTFKVNDYDAEIFVQNGDWDAAFLALGIEEAAFNFKGTPFGNCEFDYYPFYRKSLTYQEVFDGFIFYKSVRNHVLECDFPDFFETSFKEEYLRRVKLCGYSILKHRLVLSKIKRNGIVEEGYENIKSLNKQLGKLVK